MKKIELDVLPSVNTTDIIRFVELNSGKNWNESCEIVGQELSNVENNYPDQIEVEVDGTVSKVIVNKLQYDGWIKKFTETQQLRQDYYILFTD